MDVETHHCLTSRIGALSYVLQNRKRPDSFSMNFGNPARNPLVGAENEETQYPYISSHQDDRNLYEEALVDAHYTDGKRGFFLKSLKHPVVPLHLGQNCIIPPFGRFYFCKGRQQGGVYLP